MRIDEKLKMREIAGETIVLLRTKGVNDMTRLVALNESSKLIWNSFADKDFEEEDVVQLLLDTYEVEESVARADAAKFLDQMKELGIIL